MELKNNCMLIIAGPTGVGKTDLALKFAEYMSSEIVNIDVGQFYTPISIGTAKPDWKNQTVPHHLFDIINEPKSISVHEYRKIVLDKLNEIWSRGNLPILVGGSGFYINSLLFPTSSEVEPADEESNDTPESELWNILYSVDPERAKKINKQDIYRIKRALAIWKKSGEKPSQYVPDYQPPSNFVLLILTRDREELYKRIDERVIQMLKEGWLEEVQYLKSEWRDFLRQKKLIGYDDILKYFNDDFDYQTLICATQKKVRNYAKRQVTFFKMLTRKITNHALKKDNKKVCIAWADLTLLDLDLYIKQLLQSISSVCSK